MKKESRLSFRISDEMDDEIEKFVIIRRDIRDRSDLGNQAMEFYLNLLEGDTPDDHVFLKAIYQIAKETGKEDLPEIKAVKEKLDWFENIVKTPLNPKEIIKDNN